MNMDILPGYTTVNNKQKEEFILSIDKPIT